MWPYHLIHSSHLISASHIIDVILIYWFHLTSKCFHQHCVWCGFSNFRLRNSECEHRQTANCCKEPPTTGITVAAPAITVTIMLLLVVACYPRHLLWTCAGWLHSTCPWWYPRAGDTVQDLVQDPTDSQDRFRNDLKWKMPRVNNAGFYMSWLRKNSRKQDYQTWHSTFAKKLAGPGQHEKCMSSDWFAHPLWSQFLIGGKDEPWKAAQLPNPSNWLAWIPVMDLHLQPGR